MAASLRTPPRFVPTLTEVVDEPPASAAPAPPAVPIDRLAQPVADVAPVALSPAAEADADIFRIEEQLLHRVLQRIDLSLEERLTDAVSAAVQQQLDSMLPQLRAEIENVLRTVVVEALAPEFPQDAGPTPARSPLTFS